MTTNRDRELSVTELDHVVAGAPALTHESLHKSNIPKKPLIVIIAILIG